MSRRVRAQTLPCADMISLSTHLPTSLGFVYRPRPLTITDLTIEPLAGSESGSEVYSSNTRLSPAVSAFSETESQASTCSEWDLDERVSRVNESAGTCTTHLDFDVQVVSKPMLSFDDDTVNPSEEASDSDCSNSIADVQPSGKDYQEEQHVRMANAQIILVSGHSQLKTKSPIAVWEELRGKPGSSHSCLEFENDDADTEILSQPSLSGGNMRESKLAPALESYRLRSEIDVEPRSKKGPIAVWKELQNGTSAQCKARSKRSAARRQC